MIIFNKYINKVDHVWYDSSNIIYSQCYDSEGPEKTLKIVFKEGRTYLYKGVSDTDYVMFKMAESNGSMFNKIIKKYQGVRISDTDLGKLDEVKERFTEDNKVLEESTSNMVYELEVDEKTGEFRLKINGNTIYEGIEGQVSIINLLSSMRITYKMSELTEPLRKEQDFINEDVIQKK